MSHFTRQLSVSGLCLGPLGGLAGLAAGRVVDKTVRYSGEGIMMAPYVAAVGLKALIKGKSFQRAWIDEFRHPAVQSLIDESDAAVVFNRNTSVNTAGHPTSQIRRNS